jgi:Aminotransferase class-V
VSTLSVSSVVSGSSVVSEPPAGAAAAALCPVIGADLQVPVVTGGSLRYANLDYAASAPALGSVAAHVATVLPYYASVHRGAGYASQVSTALLENSRVRVGRFLGARPDDVVVFVRNTTDALNLLATAVPDGESVLSLDIEHHANLVPWQRRGDLVLPAAATLAATLCELESALATADVALVAVTGASNVTGELLPLAEIVEVAHRHGAGRRGRRPAGPAPPDLADRVRCRLRRLLGAQALRALRRRRAGRAARLARRRARVSRRGRRGSRGDDAEH